MSRARFRLPPPWISRALVVVLLLVLWEILGRMGSQLFFSPLSQVATSGVQIFVDREVLEALRTTAWILTLGFVLSVANSDFTSINCLLS